MNSPELSLVFPVYNEEDSLPLLKNELENFFGTAHSCEVIFINDGSTDNTGSILQQWAEDPKFRVIHISENIGHQQALIQGIQAARGGWVVTMDADLQDPFQTIFEMISKSKEGFEVVHAQRATRMGESFFRRGLTWVFYRVAKYFFRVPLLVDVGDFRLMSRHAIDVYVSKVKEPRVPRKEIPTLALPQAITRYRRAPRVRGKSKFSFLGLIRLGLQIIG
jgi:glycosyltransferase involved in cell wall biosynthesis